MNGLDNEYGDELECRVLDATTAESKQKIAEYGFENHGLVIFDVDGQTRKKMDGHDWTEAQIRAALNEVMANT